jgi:hypothetical protein
VGFFVPARLAIYATLTLQESWVKFRANCRGAPIFCGEQKSPYHRDTGEIKPVQLDDNVA